MSTEARWRVRHPGIGVLSYDSEDEARVAAGTAGELLPAVTSHRLVVPVPEGGWLSAFDPHEELDRTRLEDEFRLMGERSILAARLPRLGRVHARVEFCPQRIAKQGRFGLHVAEDLRQSWHPVRAALKAAGVDCATEELRFGAATGEGDPLMVVTFSAVRRG